MKNNKIHIGFWKKSILLLVATVCVWGMPYWTYKNSKMEYIGTDDLVKQQIEENYPDAEPWVDTIFSKPSKEQEQFRFRMQQGIGLVVIVLIFGWCIGNSVKLKKEGKSHAD